MAWSKSPAPAKLVSEVVSVQIAPDFFDVVEFRRVFRHHRFSCLRPRIFGRPRHLQGPNLPGTISGSRPLGRELIGRIPTINDTSSAIAFDDEN
jgi:hypothetical protein